MDEIGVRELSQRMASGEALYLIDVREEWEHALAALPGSVLIPLGELTERIDDVAPPDGALVVAYCHHGVRSRSAAAILARHGHPGVRSLAGGIDRWSLEIDQRVARY